MAGGTEELLSLSVFLRFETSRGFDEENGVIHAHAMLERYFETRG